MNIENIDDTVTHTKLINNNYHLSKNLAKTALRSWRAVWKGYFQKASSTNKCLAFGRKKAKTNLTLIYHFWRTSPYGSTCTSNCVQFSQLHFVSFTRETLCWCDILCYGPLIACLSVCLSVSRKQVLYWNGFRNGSSSFLTERQNSTYQLYIVLEGNSSIAGTRTVSSSTLSRTLNVEKFLHTRRPSQVSST